MSVLRADKTVRGYLKLSFEQNCIDSRPNWFLSHDLVCSLFASFYCSGVYNIDGTWKITSDDDERETLKDDLFYVKNDGENVKLTWISAGLIKTYGVSADGSKDDIVEDSVATSSAVMADMIGSF